MAGWATLAIVRDLQSRGVADVITPVHNDETPELWTGIYADTPQGRIEYTTALRGHIKVGLRHDRDSYAVEVMEHVVDFVLAVRALRPIEFTDADALMSAMMEMGAHESALQEGRRITLPLDGALEADAVTRERQRKELGVGPLDVEAMLAVSFPRP